MPLQRLGVALALALCSGCPAERADPGPARVAPKVAPKAEPRADQPPWAASRVGDRVDYVLHTENFEEGGGNRRETRWTLGVEVVKVEPTAVWVAVKGESAAGRALGFLIAVDPSAAPAGPERTYRRAADGGTFELHAGGTCRPWEVDQRKVDGARVAGCESDEAPFHLLRVLAFERSSSGFGEAQRVRLEAVSAKRGPEPATAGALPGLPVLFPPKGWYRRLPTEANPQKSAVQFEEQVVGGTIVRRMRYLGDLVRTRDDLARTDLTEIGGRHYIVAAESWNGLATGDLAQAVIAIARAVDGPAAPGAAGQQTISTGTLATRIPHGDRAFAADVFDAKLAGLTWGGRAEAVQTRLDGLWDWGSGPLPMAPPAAAGALPETLSSAEVDAVVQAVHAESGCPGGPVGLKLDLTGDGKATKVVATAANQKAARCLEKALMKRAWPAYRGPKRSFETELEVP